MYTRRAIIEAHYKAYQKATKKGRGTILDDLTGTTGCNRDYLAHVLSRYGKTQYVRVGGKQVRLVAKNPGKGHSKTNRGGRPGIYGDEFVALLTSIWDHFGRRCGKLLSPMLRAMIDFIASDRDFTVSDENHGLLLKVSPSTIDRLLKPLKNKLLLKGKSLTTPGPLLKNQIPVRTYFKWDERKPGFFELDTVSHCGVSTSGEFCRTLTLTDVYSGWTEERALRNNAHRWVKENVAGVRDDLPFPLLGIDSDNGGEFINHQLLAFCDEQHIQFTRSRPYRKNDNCFVEQKNGDVVRKNVGYHRYDTDSEYAALTQAYRLLCPLINFWYPTIKTIAKIKLENGRYKKIREKTPMTPYQRLLESPDVLAKGKTELRRRAALNNPVELQRLLNKAVDYLLLLNRQKADTPPASPVEAFD
jgi:hypothetical protein